MFKNLDPSDISKKSFKTFKNFTFDNNDSGSGVWSIKTRSGSKFNYVSSSDVVTTITSGSVSTNYFAYPAHAMLHNLYYSRHGRVYVPTGSQNRQLHESSSVISIARGIFGEQINPFSVKLTATIDSIDYELVDDGDGNLYDEDYSASFATYKQNNFKSGSSTTAATLGSGSQVGNVFYEQGLIVLTDTGSYTKNLDAYTLKYQSTQTHYEYEYRVTVQPNEFNGTTNISITPDRSGSITIGTGAVSMSNYFPPSHLPTGQGTGSYATFYNASEVALGFVTESTFRPYVTDIGLYNDDGQLLAHGKLAKPIKLSDEFSTTFVVRFDV